MSEEDASCCASKPWLHPAVGDELQSSESHEFRDPAKIDVVGIFPRYDAAQAAWRAKAQATVDSAETRYFIVHRRRLLEPHALQLEPAAAPRKAARKS